MQNFFIFLKFLVLVWCIVDNISLYFTMLQCFGFFKTNQQFCVSSLRKWDSFGFNTSRVYFVNINYTFVWFYSRYYFLFKILRCWIILHFDKCFEIKVLWFRHQQHWRWISMCAAMQVRSKALKLWSTFHKLLCKGTAMYIDVDLSGISDFLLPSGCYLPKSRGSQTYFATCSVRSKKAPPPGIPKIDAYGYVSCSLLVIRGHFHTFKSVQQFFD